MNAQCMKTYTNIRKTMSKNLLHMNKKGTEQ